MSTQARFVWYDLQTVDRQAAIAFYTRVIGWQTEHWQGDEPYTMFKAGESTIGGVMELPEEARQMGAPPHWMGYVGTPDVDATTEKAAELGGNILMDPEDIPEVGRFSILQDPQGSVFAAFEPVGSMDGGPDMSAPRNVVWHELYTSDPEAAWDFYAALFGWEKTDAMETEAGTYQMFGQGEQIYGAMMKKPDQMPMSAWQYYIDVEELEPALERVKSNGGKVILGPMDVPGGARIAQGIDPQGAAFALHSMK